MRALWRGASIEETKLEKAGETFPYAVEEHLEWIAPVIFISASVVSQNPHLVSIALGVIANYLTDWFKGLRVSAKARLTVVVEKEPSRLYRKLTYEGPPGQIKELEQAVFAVLDNE